MKIKEMLINFIKDEEGLTMVEYAIAGAMIAATAVGAFQALGGAVETRIDGLTDNVNLAS